MKLFEVIQLLLENKVEHIAKNQTRKIWDRLVDDHSLKTFLYEYHRTSRSWEPLYGRHHSEYKYDTLIQRRIMSEEVFEAVELVVMAPLPDRHVSRLFFAERIKGYSSEEELRQLIQNAVESAIKFIADNISKKHLQWVVNRYIAEDFALGEDFQIINNDLDIYDQMKSEIGVPLTNKISTADLFDLTEPYRDVMDAEAAKAKEKELLAKGAIEIPFSQGPKELVIIPKTFEASYYLSEPNGWCTQDEGWFNSYTAGNKTLYYFRHQGKPHLVHFESNQFMKKGNRPFDVKSVRESSPAFQWIIKQMKKRVENVAADKISSAAFNMIDRVPAIEPEWAMEIIENDNITSTTNIAYLMVNGGHAPAEWGRKVIENNDTRDSLDSLHPVLMMVEHGYAKPEWAMKIIENSKGVKNTCWYAYQMVKGGYTKDIERAMRIIENNKTDNSASASAYGLVELGHTPQEWYDKHFG